LPNVGPYIYDVSISGFTRSSIYIYDISSLRVNYGHDGSYHPTELSTGRMCNRYYRRELPPHVFVPSLFLAQQPSVGQGLLIHEDSRSHSTMHHSR